jgi:hypothetical protein
MLLRRPGAPGGGVAAGQRGIIKRNDCHIEPSGNFEWSVY